MPDLHEVEIVPNVLIPCDGYELAADLYRPRDAGPAPALVTLMPYNKDWSAAGAYWNACSYFAAHGYPSLLADFRGTGSSSGEVRPPFHPGEGDDGVALVEWAATQPWCDGAVGMWGMSYGGITSLRTASRRPAALKAIIPIMGQIDPEWDFVNPGGVRGMLAPFVWALQNLALQLTPPLCFDEDGRWERIWRERLDRADLYLRTLFERSPRSDEWREGAIAVEEIEAPTLCVTGWRDLVCAAMIAAFERLRAPKRLLAGPWMHAMPQDAEAHTVDFLPAMLSWWDRWLRGDAGAGDTGGPAATVFTLGRDAWSTFEEWPGPEQATTDFALAGDGSLGGEAGGRLTTVDDATVGVHGGLSWYQSSGYGLPDDQHEDDRHSLTFTSEPLLVPVEILGRPWIRLTFGDASTMLGPLVVKLADVDGQGRSHPIVAGASIMPDLVVEMELPPTSYEVAAGHRLRITIARDDFPRLWPDPDALPLTVVCDPQNGASRLVLPLAPVEGRAPFEWAVPADVELPPMFLEPPTSHYEVARELIEGRVSVTLGDRLRMRPPNVEGTLVFDQAITAEVRAGARAEARLTGQASTTVTFGSERLEVRAELVAEGEHAIVTGKVTRAGEVAFERRWTLQRR